MTDAREFDFDQETAAAIASGGSSHELASIAQELVNNIQLKKEKFETIRSNLTLQEQLIKSKETEITLVESAAAETLISTITRRKAYIKQFNDFIKTCQTRIFYIEALNQQVESELNALIEQAEQQIQRYKERSITTKDDDATRELSKLLILQSKNIGEKLITQQEAFKEIKRNLEAQADLTTKNKITEEEEKELQKLLDTLKNKKNPDIVLTPENTSTTIHKRRKEVEKCLDNHKELIGDIEDLNLSTLECINYLQKEAELGDITNKSNPLDIIEEATDLESVFKKINDLVKVSCYLKKIGVTFNFKNVSDEEKWVMVDPHFLTTITYNIVRNSIKHTEERTTPPIDVCCEKIATQNQRILFRITIRDYGQGMTQEQIKALKEQTLTSTQGTAGERGHGVGMEVVGNFLKLLNKQNNTEFEIESKTKESDMAEHGTTIRFTFNASLASRQQIQPLQNASNSEKRNTPHPVIKFPTTQAVVKKKLTVLYADDTPTNLAVAKKILENLDAKVITAGNYEEALQKWKESKPDVVFLDIEMGKKTGFDIAESIRKEEIDERLEATPLYFLSGHIESTYSNQLKQVNAKGYIKKPFIPKKFADVLDNHKKQSEHQPSRFS